LGKEIVITYNVWYEEPLDEKLITWSQKESDVTIHWT
jgi:hypothetical protein